LLCDTALKNAVDAALLVLDVTTCTATQFERNPHSGKTPLVIDRRQRRTTEKEFQ
jgi:phenylacetate-CoA ligase